jgi:hypothetical protein
VPHNIIKEDTPEERDAKAVVLAAQFERFKWEMRFYMILLMTFIIVKGL